MEENFEKLSLDDQPPTPQERPATPVNDQAAAPPINSPPRRNDGRLSESTVSRVYLTVQKDVFGPRRRQSMNRFRHRGSPYPQHFFQPHLSPRCEDIDYHQLAGELLEHHKALNATHQQNEDEIEEEPVPQPPAAPRKSRRCRCISVRKRRDFRMRPRRLYFDNEDFREDEPRLPEQEDEEERQPRRENNLRMRPNLLPYQRGQEDGQARQPRRENNLRMRPNLLPYQRGQEDEQARPLRRDLNNVRIRLGLLWQRQIDLNNPIHRSAFIMELIDQHNRNDAVEPVDVESDDSDDSGVGFRVHGR